MSDKSKDDLVKYKLDRAKETIDEIDEHLGNGFYHTAVNRIYYASFYAISALLLKYDLDARTHAGVRKLFGQHFILEKKITRDLGKFYTEIFDYRQSSDYDDFIDMDEPLIREHVQKAKELILQIELLLK